LLKVGVVSVDRDVSSFAVRAWSTLEARGRVLDREPSQSRPAATRLASIETAPAEPRSDD
jgi:hypothetical protein